MFLFKMKKDEWEALRLRVATFYIDTACGNLKTTWNFFKKEGFCYSTIYRIIKRYVQFKTTKDLPRSGRPRKLSNKQIFDQENVFANKIHILAWLSKDTLCTTSFTYIRSKWYTFCTEGKNPPNVPQARPIEDVWDILKKWCMHKIIKLKI